MPLVEAVRKEFGRMLPLYLRKPGDKRKDKIKPEDGTPVGKLDVYAQDRLIRVVKRFFPNDVFLAEEDMKSPKEIKKILADQTTYQWSIDGLDGTGNRGMRLLSFGAMLALRKGNKIVLAILFRPADEKLTKDGFFFATEKGAFNWRGDLGKYKRIRTAKPGQLERTTVLLEGSSKKFGKPPLSNLVVNITTRASLSSVIAATTVARGEASAYVCEGNKVWDIWPAWRVIESAGGCIANFDGERPTVNNCEDVVIAANPTDLAEALASLNKEG